MCVQLFGSYEEEKVGVAVLPMFCAIENPWREK